MRILSGSWFLSLKWIWIGAGDRWNAANQTRGGTEKTICEMFFKTDISGLFSVMEEYQHSVPLPQHSQQRSQHTVLANSKKVELCKMAFGHGSFFWVHFKARILGAVGEDFRHNAQGCRKLLSLRLKVFLLLKLTCSAFDPRQEAHLKIPSYSAKPSVGVF